MAKSISGGGFGEDIYSGTASYGRFMGWVGGIFGIIIGLVLLGVGLYLALSKTVYTGRAVATVRKIDPPCYKDPTNSASNNVICDVTLEYMVNNQKYERVWILTNLSQGVVVGSTQTIRYNPDNPQDIAFGISQSTVGWIMSGIAVFILAGCAINIYAVTRYDVAAAATGVGSAAGIIRNYIR